MIKLFSYLLIVSCCLHSTNLAAQTSLHTDVLVIGGGTGGTAAGIQCARMGVATIIAEPTTWLGGMLSAAGVSAIDGNHRLPSGIWAEFRGKLYEVYGGADKVATGWVSNTQFEPHVGDSILKTMAAPLNNLKILYRYSFLRSIVKNKQVTGAVFLNKQTNQPVTIYARQVIDATELGDVMASAGIPFNVGMEASSVTGENINVPANNNIIQDMTYSAVLKDYGAATNNTIPKPANYFPEEFDGACTNYYHNPSRKQPTVDAIKMLEYGKLPNNKYMINWPNYGNDIYLNLVNLNEADRNKKIIAAKQQTLRFIYFIQTQLGFKNLGLADDEFPTKDRLPIIPYHREGRRVKGLVRYKIQHISQPFDEKAPLYRTGISVGDYPIDHHHKKNPAAPQHLDFYPVPSFNIPLGALIPVSFTGIIIAEKGISVSNVVNGSSRLQPCVMLTGQAAGTLAALCIQQKKQAAQVRVRDVQQQLLNSNAYIMPYVDVTPASPYYQSIQRLGATGILKGKPEPYKWENRTWFYPDSFVNTQSFIADFKPFAHLEICCDEQLTIGNASGVLIVCGKKINPKNSGFDFEDGNKLMEQLSIKWTEWGLQNFDSGRKITRAELAVLLDKTIDPFQWMQVAHSGELVLGK